MVTSKQLKEKMRDYRRAFKHNWGLFKENRVGLLGLGIMLAFVVIAVTSPMMGLRHPIEWMAPDSDVVIVDNYFDPTTNGPITTELATRIHPTGGDTTPVDRIYFAGGDGSNAAPYGIYSKSVEDGSNAWQIGTFSKAFMTNSPITASPVGVDFGNSKYTDDLDFWLFFGTESGRVYSIQDGNADDVNPVSVPSGDAVWSEQLTGGAVMGVAIHNEAYGDLLDEQDMLFVTTETAVYGFRAERGNVYDSYTNTTTVEFLGWQQIWMNDTVLSSTTNSTTTTLTAPAVNADGTYIYVGATDGMLYAFNVQTGVMENTYDLYDPAYDYATDATQLQIPERQAANERRGYWSSRPYAAQNKIVATTDDGRIHVIYSADASPLAGWEGGYPLNLTATDLDLGNLTNPYVSDDGSQILVGSDSGYVFRVAIGELASGDSPINQIFDTTLNKALPTKVTSTPYWDNIQKYIYVPARNTLGNSDPSDDYTILYCINTESKTSSVDAITGETVGASYVGQGNVTWRKTVPGVTFGRPIVYDDWAGGGDGHLSTVEIAFATVALDSNGTPLSDPNSKIYSFSAAGRMITPLPPTWAISPTITNEDGIEIPNDKWTNQTEGADHPHESGNTYFLGTDAQGRDVLSQTLLGSRIALLVGFAAAIFSISIGMLVGLVSGYYGGNVDTLLMRFTDVILVLPGLPMLIILAAVMEPSIWNIVFIIGIVGWGGTARVIRSEVLTLKERPFIDSARVTGASKARIMFRHIAPNILPLAVLYMTFYVSGAILSEASLSFIGLGDPRTMSWGMMLNFVQHANALTAWWWLLPPGISITLICLAFFLLGRAFDEIVNPRLRRRR